MGYELHDEAGVRFHVFHTDRVLCDDEGCPCKLPSTAQKRATDRAERSGAFYVSQPDAKGFTGPLDERRARSVVDHAIKSGRKPLLLRVAEDYS
jgi:hypothetical protein